MTTQAQTGAAGGTVGRYGVLTVLVLIYTFNILDRQIVSILAQPIKLELGLSDTQLGLLTGLAFALFYSIFGVPVGWLADRFGRVRVMALACIVWSACTASAGLATNFVQLALARVGVGIGEAGGAPPSYSLIADYFPAERRAMALGVYSFGAPIGILLGTALGGWVAVEFGWRSAFYVVGIPGVVLALLLWATVREPKAGRLDATPAPTQRVGVLESVRGFFSDPLLVWVSVASGLSAFATYGMLNWVPSFLMRTKGMQMSEVAAYLSVATAGGMALGLWLGGVTADRWAKRNAKAYAFVPCVSLLVGAPLYLAAVLAPTWQTSLLLFVAPIALAIVFMGPALAVVQNMTPPGRRTVASAMFLLINNLIGLGCGPLFIGMVSDFAAPAYGDRSLVVAMLSLTPIFLIGAGAHYYVSKIIGRRTAAA